MTQAERLADYLRTLGKAKDKIRRHSHYFPPADREKLHADMRRIQDIINSWVNPDDFKPVEEIDELAELLSEALPSVKQNFAWFKR